MTKVFNVRPIQIGVNARGGKFCSNPVDIIDDARSLGMTTSDIAGVAGISPVSVHRWEAKNRGQLDKVEILHKYLLRRANDLARGDLPIKDLLSKIIRDYEAHVRDHEAIGVDLKILQEKISNFSL